MRTIVLIWLATLLIPAAMAVALCFASSRDRLERFTAWVEERMGPPLLIVGGLIVLALSLVLRALVAALTPRSTWQQFRADRRLKKEHPERWAQKERAWQDIF